MSTEFDSAYLEANRKRIEELERRFRDEPEKAPRAKRKPKAALVPHKEKTRNDVREIARAKRLSGETSSQWDRRKKFGPTFKSKNTFRSHHRYG